AVVGAVNRKVGDADGIGPAVGFATDRYTVPGVEMVVRDGHVGAVAARFNGHVVIAGGDVAVRDGHIGGSAGVDAVGVPRTLPGCVDRHAPHRESVSAAVGHVEIAGVLHGDAVQGKIVAARKHHQARAILVSAGPGLLGQV